jgi:hypothetical protein
MSSEWFLSQDRGFSRARRSAHLRPSAPVQFGSASVGNQVVTSKSGSRAAAGGWMPCHGFRSLESFETPRVAGRSPNLGATSRGSTVSLCPSCPPRKRAPPGAASPIGLLGVPVRKYRRQSMERVRSIAVERGFGRIRHERSAVGRVILVQSRTVSRAGRCYTRPRDSGPGVHGRRITIRELPASDGAVARSDRIGGRSTRGLARSGAATPRPGSGPSRATSRGTGSRGSAGSA